MYNIIQLNDKNLSELQVIAKELGIKKADSYKKEDLVYKILDEQAIVGATKKVAADKLKEERKNEEQKKKRSRVAPTKKEDKVVSATKSEEANKTKETAPVKAAPQPSKKEESTNKEKETVVVEAKAENTATPKRKVGRPRKSSDAEEKKEAIRMLKLGRNPWREQYKSNWQLQRIAEEFHRTANIYELIRTYAPDTGNVNDALRNIIQKQKEIAEEKKVVKTKLRDYKPIIDLYKEAVKHEKRAYLYEFAGCDEYLSDYLEYKMLVDRLEKGYSKTINEVAEYVEEEENQILYAKAQAKELSSAYHTILRFAQNELRQQEAEYMSLYEAIGYAKAKTAAVHQGVFESSIKYIAADSVDDGYIRVVILPDIVGGTRTVTATVSVYGKNGELKKEFSSQETNVKEFNQNISELKADMGFYRCHSADEARVLMKAQEEKKEKNRIKN